MKKEYSNHEPIEHKLTHTHTHTHTPIPCGEHGPQRLHSSLLNVCEAVVEEQTHTPHTPAVGREMEDIVVLAEREGG